MKKTVLLIALSLIGLLGCEQEPTPEDALRTWLGYMQNGECDKAARMIIESSMEPIELDCEAYDAEIISITCESREESSNCDCIELKNGSEEKQEYDLKKVDGGWKLAAGFQTL